MAQQEEDTWCLIESDPGVFWDIAKKLGVQGLDFQELYTLDANELKQVCGDGALGLIFLFRWHPHLKSVLDNLGQCLPDVPTSLFYAKQVIQNSCATQAMLSIILNKRSEITIGPILEDFCQFTSKMTPEMCGFCLANQKDVREAHNSYRSTSALSIGNERSSGPKEDPFHFISLVPDDKTKNVYLLDGLMEGPILLGQFNQLQDWHNVALPAVQKIIETLQTLPASGSQKASTDIRFNLIAALPDMRDQQRRQRHQLQQEMAGALRALLLVENDNDAAKLARYKLEAVTPEEFQQQPKAEDCKAKISMLSLELEGLRQSIDMTNKRHDAWTKENLLRQHDLMPFYLTALRNLAKRKLLTPAYEEALRKSGQ